MCIRDSLGVVVLAVVAAAVVVAVAAASVVDVVVDYRGIDAGVVLVLSECVQLIAAERPHWTMNTYEIKAMTE